MRGGGGGCVTSILGDYIKQLVVYAGIGVLQLLLLINYYRP